MSDLEELGIFELRKRVDLVGGKYTARTKKADLIKMLRSGGEHFEAEPEKEAEHKESFELLDTHEESSGSGNRIKIIVSKSEHDKHPVQVGVNGTVYLIKRGESVSVPPEVVEVLENAVKYVDEKNAEHDPKDSTSPATISVAVPRYPFQRVS